MSLWTGHWILLMVKPHHITPCSSLPRGCFVSISIVGAFKCYFLSLSQKQNVLFLQWSLCSTVLVFFLLLVWNVMFEFAQNPLSLTQGSPNRNTSVSDAPSHVIISNWVKPTCPFHPLLYVWLPALPNLWLAYYYFLPICLTFSLLTLLSMPPPDSWIVNNTLLL